MSNVTTLIERTHNPKHWSVKDCLESALQEAEGSDANKALVILLNQRDGSFDYTWLQAGLQNSECIALLEIAKNDFLSSM